METVDVLLEIGRRVLPIVLGAGIGFITNMIAIKMLFRPLKEYRIFGLRIPFTPGIIPRQRRALAESIGNMVSGQLLGRDAVIAHLRSTDFQRSLGTSIEDVLYLPDTGDPPPRNPLVSRLADLVRGFATEERISTLLSQAGGSIGRLEISELVPERALKGPLRAFIDRQTENGIGPRLVDELNVMAERLVRENRNLESILTPELKQGLRKIVEALYGPAVAFLMEWLRRPVIKKELISRGKKILWDILNQLTLVQRLFLSAGQYDRTLEERMPAIIADLLATLESTLLSGENRERIFDGLGEALDRLTGMSLSDLQGVLGSDFPELVRRAGTGFLTLLRTERVGLRVEIHLRRLFDRRRRTSLRSILRLVSGMRVDELASRFSRSAAAWIRRPDSLEEVFEKAVSMFMTDTSVRSLSVGRIVSGLQGFLEKAVPELVERLDIKTLVVNRINGLDVKAVEDLLLSVMARHFKWINVFGAILGAIIGALQLIPGVGN